MQIGTNQTFSESCPLSEHELKEKTIITGLRITGNIA